MAQNMMDERLKQLKEMLRLEKEITKEKQKQQKTDAQNNKKKKQKANTLNGKDILGAGIAFGALKTYFSALGNVVGNFVESIKRGTEDFKKLTKTFSGAIVQASNSINKANLYKTIEDVHDAAEDYVKATTASGVSNLIAGAKNKVLQYADTYTTAYANAKEASRYAETMSLFSQRGYNVTQYQPLYDTASNIALQMTKEAYDRAGIKIDDVYAKATDEFESYFQGYLGILSGGSMEGTPFTSEGWEGFAYNVLGIDPNVVGDNEPLKADIISKYFNAQQEAYKKDSIGGVGKLVNESTKQTRLLKNMSGNLYGFDEVITNQATSQADTVEELKENGDVVASVKQTAQDAAEQASRDALLQQNKTDMVRKVLEDGEVTQEEIQWLLDNGFNSVEEIAVYIAKLQGIEPTLANINAISSALDDTLKNGVTLSINRLNEILAEGIKVKIDNNLNLDNYNLTPEQMAELAKALADNLLTDEEIERLKTLGFTDDQINQILEDLGIIKRNTGLTAYNNASEIMQKVGTPYQKFLSAVANTIGPSLEDYGIGEDEKNILIGAGTGMTFPKKASGGIGTSPSIIEAFEKGPEAIIPLNDSGIQFMSDAIRNANVEGNLGGSGDINVNLTLSGLNISDKRDWEEVGIKIGQVIQNYKNRTGGI